MGVTVCMADYAQGRQRFEESYSLFSELDHRWGMAWALNAWGTMSMFLGAYGDARRRLEEGLAIYRALGNQPGVAGSVSRLAWIACIEGRFAEAERLAREGVAISMEAGGRTQSALALLELGEVLESGQVLGSPRCLAAKPGALHRPGPPRLYHPGAHSWAASACTWVVTRRPTTMLQTGLALAREHGPRFCVGRMPPVCWAAWSLLEAAPATAHQLLEESADVYREVKHKDDLGVVLACLAVAARWLGDMRGVRRHLRHSP